MRIVMGSLLAMALLPAVVRADGLMVYGDDWSFIVAEPAGWHGDTEKARTYHVNIAFFPAAPSSRAADVTIRVKVNTKTDERIEQDLKADMDGYRKEYPKVRFEELEAKHPKYPTEAKLFFVPGELYEYVAYLNPGKEFPFTLSVAMSKKAAPASDEERAAYEEVLRSIIFARKEP